MLGWDKSVRAGEADNDITELLVLIRRRSGHGELESGKPAEVKPCGHGELQAKPAELKVLSLARRGYYRGPIDGIAGKGTRRAILTYRADHGLRVISRIDNELLNALG